MMISSSSDESEESEESLEEEDEDEVFAVGGATARMGLWEGSSSGASSSESELESSESESLDSCTGGTILVAGAGAVGSIRARLAGGASSTNSSCLILASWIRIAFHSPCE